MRIINIVFARIVWTHPFAGRDNQQHEPHPVPIGVYAHYLRYLVYAQKEIRVSRIRPSRKARAEWHEPWILILYSPSGLFNMRVL